ncbi:glycosyltransferase family 4 protein [Mesobacillus subterraneus]|uniref:glycosyltransferase family 4 protein n=1 Tax=Mesobacillus subterraneus TaxID=285983 RepID=UPI001CFCE6DB|nr:glycosyltransferase family 4 protein [Mesobacillus subterraneus]
MKILHINSYFNGSSFYKNLYDKQKENGLDIDVFVPVSKLIKEPSYYSGSYTVFSKNHNKYDRFFFRYKCNKILKDIKHTFNVEEYSVVHAHSLFSNGFIALKLKKRFNIPYIVAVRNTDVNIFFKYMLHLREIGVDILREAEKVIFLSEPYKNIVIEKYVPNELKKNVSNKSVIIPNGIDDFWFENKNKCKSPITEKKIQLLYVGVINKNKNILTTVKVIEKLQTEGLDVTLTVVGRIVDKKVFNQIVNLPFIQYLEPLSKEALIKIYRSNDIFIMPSIHETFGLVYAEALSQGLPVLYSKGQGFDGQFPNGEIGYSVNANSAREITGKIKEILTNYETISMNCVKKVDKFNWKRISDDYHRIYSQVDLRLKQKGIF